jgi:hypothetical protein
MMGVGAWLDSNPGVALTLFGMLLTGVVYIIRMEGELKGLKARVAICEDRADEDREQIKEALSGIGHTVDGIKTTLNQLVGALGRRSSDQQFSKG